MKTKMCIDCNQPTYSARACRCAEHARIARNAQQIAYNRERRRAKKAERDEIIQKQTRPATKPETWAEVRARIKACVGVGGKYRPA